MSEIFKGNLYPQTLYSATEEPIVVSSKKEYEEKVREGWSPQHIPRDFPKWVKGSDGVKVLCADEAAAAKLTQGIKVADKPKGDKG